MRQARKVVVSMMIGAAFLSTAAPAGAELKGGCEAAGVFAQGTDAEGSFTVDSRAVGTDTVVIPRQDSVQWSGSVSAPPGNYAGFVAVELPPPFGEVTIDSWSGNSDATENSGVKEYDLPQLVPSGVSFRVVGEHADDSTQCEGFVNVELEGGPFKSPVTPVALLITAVAALAFALALRPLFRRGAR